jgi:hypothetical protein
LYAEVIFLVVGRKCLCSLEPFLPSTNNISANETENDINGKQIRIRKEEAVGCLKLLSWHSLGVAG